MGKGALSTLTRPRAFLLWLRGRFGMYMPPLLEAPGCVHGRERTRADNLSVMCVCGEAPWHRVPVSI